jgi:uncharacterized membrane protein (DUF2068 family)
VTRELDARGFRLIALFEAGKGVLALLGAVGLLRLVHRDVREVLESVMEHVRLNPAAREPAVLLRLAEHATDPRLRLLAAGVLLYAGTRLVEAWGLWHERSWAAWIGVITAGAYVPIELVEIARHPRPIAFVALGVNLAVLAWLAHGIWGGRRRPADRP